jgi:hypothetical protein
LSKTLPTNPVAPITANFTIKINYIINFQNRECNTYILLTP